MEKFTEEIDQILNERFGNDNIIALATTLNNVPYVRYVDAFYENKAFYILTYALSNKIQQINQNSSIAIAGEWFSGQGKGINLGYFGNKENEEIACKMRDKFASWINNGHNNFDDINTIILKI